jgi:hypothetical protein
MSKRTRVATVRVHHAFAADEDEEENVEMESPPAQRQDRVAAGELSSALNGSSPPALSSNLDADHDSKDNDVNMHDGNDVSIAPYDESDLLDVHAEPPDLYRYQVSIDDDFDEHETQSSSYGASNESKSANIEFQYSEEEKNSPYFPFVSQAVAEMFMWLVQPPLVSCICMRAHHARLSVPFLRYSVTLFDALFHIHIFAIVQVSEAKSDSLITLWNRHCRPESVLPLTRALRNLTRKLPLLPQHVRNDLHGCV